MQLWKDEEVAFDFGLLSFSCPAISILGGLIITDLCYNEGVYLGVGNGRKP